MDVWLGSQRLANSPVFKSLVHGHLDYSFGCCFFFGRLGWCNEHGSSGEPDVWRIYLRARNEHNSCCKFPGSAERKTLLKGKVSSKNQRNQMRPFQDSRGLIFWRGYQTWILALVNVKMFLPCWRVNDECEWKTWHQAWIWGRQLF